MTLRNFVRQNRADIDIYIKQKCKNCKINDAERENWVMNDEYLYLWAKACRVTGI